MQLGTRIFVLAVCGFSACAFPDYRVEPVDPLASICSDERTSPAETGIDCGGGCPPCRMGQPCRTFRDCVSLSCNEGTCQMPTCTDGVKNASEADVDCGGQCGACAPGRDCQDDADCADGVCADSFCQRPSCDDRAHNGDETGVDCGGSCLRKCELGEGCDENDECSSAHCAGNVCVAPGCTDTQLNGDESDLDCGGRECGPCPPGAHCSSGTDCSSQICEQEQCTAFSCSDQVLNGQESAVDCGGGNCAGCADLERCRDGADCASGGCLRGLCVPAEPTEVPLSRAGWVATASDTYPDHSPNQVLDSSGGRWTSGTRQYDGMSFEIDMGSLQTFFAIAIRCEEAPDDRLGKFDVYVSADQSYGDPALPTQRGSTGTTFARFETAQLARHVKIVLREAGTKWWSIDEVNVLK